MRPPAKKEFRGYRDPRENANLIIQAADSESSYPRRRAPPL
jgi:hypothetical protein